MLIKSVLFDLDGTILDTAPDILNAINQVRVEYKLSELALESIRPMLNLGSKKILKQAFDIDENNENFANIRELFFANYLKCLANSTQFFPNVLDVLDFLDEKKIAWGIVTNKLAIHTNPLLMALNFKHRPQVIVCGDSLSTSKPHPAPILHACHALRSVPNECLYVGDALTDVMAGKAAGTKSLVALYGYIGNEEDPYTWDADGYISNASEIIKWLEDSRLE